MTQTPANPAADRPGDLDRLAGALAGLARFAEAPERARVFAGMPAVRAAVGAHLDAIDSLWRILGPAMAATPVAASAPPPTAAPERVTTVPRAPAPPPALHSAMREFFNDTFGGTLAAATADAAPESGTPARVTAPLAPPVGPAPIPAPIPAPATPAAAPALFQVVAGRHGGGPTTPLGPYTDETHAPTLAATLPPQPPAWPWGRPETMTLSHMSLPPAMLATIDALTSPLPEAPADAHPATVSTSALGQPNFELLSAARVGEPFGGDLSGVGPGGRRARVVAVDVPPELGLYFDAARQALKGVPMTDGTFTLNLRWLWLDAVAPGATPGTGRVTLRVAAGTGTGIGTGMGAGAGAAWPAPAGFAGTLVPGPPPATEPAADDALTLLLRTDTRRLLAATLRTRPTEPGRRDDFFLGSQGGWALMALTAATAAGDTPPEDAPVRDGALLALSVLTGESGRQAPQLLGAGAVAGWHALSPTAHSAIYRVAYDALCHGAHRIRNSLKAAAPAAAGAAGAIVLVAHREVVQGHLVMAFHAGTAGLAALNSRQGQPPLKLSPESARACDESLFTDAQALMDRLTVALVPSYEALALGAGSAWLDDAERWNGLWPSLQAMLRRPNPEPAALEWLQNRRPADRRPADQSLLVLWPG